MNADTCATVLRDARRARGWPQDKVAELLGVEQTHISQWETRRRQPTLTHLIAWAEVLGYQLRLEAVDELVAV